MPKIKHSLKDRRNDLYETPSEATWALLLQSGHVIPRNIWEPACGPGAISDVLKLAGKRVWQSDLVDYRDRNPGMTAGVDFLIETEAPRSVEAIVSNPPYKLATRFVRKAIEMVPIAFMLLRLSFLEGEKRSDLIDEHLLAVHPFRNRLPMMHRDGWEGPKATSQTAHAWFVFTRERCHEPTYVKRLTAARPKLSIKAPAKIKLQNADFRDTLFEIA